MIRVFFNNFMYYAQDPFPTLEDAKQYARDKGYDVSFVDEDSNVIGSWSLIGGYRSMR